MHTLRIFLATALLALCSAHAATPIKDAAISGNSTISGTVTGDYTRSGTTTGGTHRGATLSDAAATNEPDFTIVVIPDTQTLTEAGATEASVLQAQFQWAATHKSAENIKAVISVGDLTNVPDADRMGRALAAYNIAKAAGLPVVPIVGNHDYDGAAPAARATTGFDAYFGPSYFAGAAYYGGSTYPTSSNANYYITFTNGTQAYVVLALEFFPRAAAVSWAQGIIAAHPNAYIIITTHAYLRTDGQRTLDADTHGPAAYSLPSGDYNAQEIYDALVKPYSNVRIVLGGHHVDGAPFVARSSVISATTGAVTHEFFTNYQTEAAAGHYMMILRFKPATGSIAVSYYSPTLDQEDAANPSVELPFSPVRVEKSIAVGTDAFVGRDLRVTGRAFLGSGQLLLANRLATVGAFDATFVFSGATAVTFPLSGTLATLAGAESLSNKTLVSPNIGAATGTSVTLSGGTSKMSAPLQEHLRLNNRFSFIGGSNFHITNNAYYDGTSFRRTVGGAAAGRLLIDASGNLAYGALPSGDADEVLIFGTQFSVTPEGNATAGGWVKSGGYYEGAEQGASPAAPTANGWRLYAKDNGAGKTVLYVRFATGAEQQIAIEP